MPKVLTKVASPDTSGKTAGEEPRVRTTYDRFWELVDRSAGPGGCWPWRGRRTPAGIPVFEVRKRRTTARRYAYRMEYGDPGSLRIVVTCTTADCMNYRHLTAAAARTIALSNGSAAAQHAARTACRRGHLLQAGNLYVRADGRRECLHCKRGRVAPRPPGKPS